MQVIERNSILAWSALVFIKALIAFLRTDVTGTNLDARGLRIIERGINYFRDKSNGSIQNYSFMYRTVRIGDLSEDKITQLSLSSDVDKMISWLISVFNSMTKPRLVIANSTIMR